MIEALLWDVDGTLAETERDGHRLAFNEAFSSMGLAWAWDVAHYGQLLRVTGGRERILADMAAHADAPATQGEREALARELHRRKNVAYERRLAAGAITLRPGVASLLDDAVARGLRMAIVTTTSRANVAALLRHALGSTTKPLFETIVCGEDVAAKKPDPEAYLLALHHLGLAPLATLAIEDSPAGVAAARAADVPVIVTRSAYFEADTVEGVLAVGPGLHTRRGWHPALSADVGNDSGNDSGNDGGPDSGPNRGPGSGPDSGLDRRVTLDDLFEWHARMDFVSQFG